MRVEIVARARAEMEDELQRGLEDSRMVRLYITLKRPKAHVERQGLEGECQFSVPSASRVGSNYKKITSSWKSQLVQMNHRATERV